MTFDVGRLVVKIAGRDAGKKGIIVDVLDNAYVLVDGAMRRKKVNLRHLEPLNEILPLKAGASHEEVQQVLQLAGLTVLNTKPKQAAPRPRVVKKKTEDQGKKKTVPVKNNVAPAKKKEEKKKAEN